MALAHYVVATIVFTLAQKGKGYFSTAIRGANLKIWHTNCARMGSIPVDANFMHIQLVDLAVFTKGGTKTDKHIMQKEILREHVYKDEQGHPIRKAIKYTDGSWAQMRHEKGGWKPGVKGTRNVLYGLDRLTEDYSNNIIFIFEGEKDCERAWENGLQATTNVQGAGKWSDSLNGPLNGRTVCIVPDKDEAGENHAQKVQSSLQRSGIDCFILFDYAKNLPAKSDFCDWMDANGENVDIFLELTETAKVKANNPNDTRYEPNLIKASEYKLRKPEYWVADIIEKRALTFVVGASGCGKTFVATDLAVSIGLGHNFHGKHVEKGLVIISAGEDQDGQVARLRAAAEHKKSKLENADIYIAKRPLVFSDETTLSEFCREIEENHKGKIAVIIIDTMARAMVGTDENSSKDMSLFIYQCDQFRERFECSVVVLHHTGHEGQRGRGSSARKGAADAENLISAEGGKIGSGGKICLRFDKVKNARTPEPIYFSTDTHVLFDDDAEFFETLVLNITDAPKQSQRSQQLTPGEEQTLNTFKEAQWAKCPDPEAVASKEVSLDEWRPVFRKKHTGNNDKSKDAVFSRDRKSLVNKGFLKVEDNIYSLGNMATS